MLTTQHVYNIISSKSIETFNRESLLDIIIYFIFDFISFIHLNFESAPSNK